MLLSSPGWVIDQYPNTGVLPGSMSSSMSRVVKCRVIDIHLHIHLNINFGTKMIQAVIKWVVRCAVRYISLTAGGWVPRW